MSRQRLQMLGRAARAAALCAAVVATAACGGIELGVDYPSDYYGYYGEYPPDAYIATTEPLYFNGRASYFYGGRWYYREGGRWNVYDREPTELYQRRMQAMPMRRTYESWRGHPEGRSPARSGGWRGGHH